MAAPAEAPEGVEGERDMLGAEGRGLDRRPGVEGLQVGQPRFASPGQDHHAGFEQGGRPAQAGRIHGDRLDEGALFRLAQQDGEQGRAVDHHQDGRPFSS